MNSSDSEIDLKICKIQNSVSVQNKIAWILMTISGLIPLAGLLFSNYIEYVISTILISSSVLFISILIMIGKINLMDNTEIIIEISKIHDIKVLPILLDSYRYINPTLKQKIENSLCIIMNQTTPESSLNLERRHTQFLADNITYNYWRDIEIDQLTLTKAAIHVLACTGTESQLKLMVKLSKLKAKSQVQIYLSEIISNELSSRKARLNREASKMLLLRPSIIPSESLLIPVNNNVCDDSIEGVLVPINRDTNLKHIE